MDVALSRRYRRVPTVVGCRLLVPVRLLKPAMKLGVVEDFVLPAAALATCAVLVYSRFHRAVG